MRTVAAPGKLRFSVLTVVMALVGVPSGRAGAEGAADTAANEFVARYADAPFVPLDAKPGLRPGCSAQMIPVRDDNQIYGELCLPTDGSAPTAVQLLLHGITYSTLYWDWPIEPEKYSYVEYMTGHGYATLNVDRIGIGRSSHPASSTIT